MLADYEVCRRFERTHQCASCRGKTALVTRFNQQAQSWEVYCPCGETEQFIRPQSLTARWRENPDSVPITVANRLADRYRDDIEVVAEGLPPELAAVVRTKYLGPRTTGKGTKMPIKGLTDSVQAAFPRLGKLRKGGEAPRNQSGQVVRMGQDLDHFRFSSDRPGIIAAFDAAYGKSPALVNAYLPYPDVERNFTCWREKWVAGGLVHRCDGETMTMWLGQDGKYHRGAQPCDGGCDEVGRLSIIIPELVQAGFVGYVTLETHSINDILSIQASLMAALEARADNPLGLRGIRWTLRRVKEKVSTPMGNGKRARREKWLVKLEPAADWVQLQIQAAHNATMMLPAGRNEPVELDHVTSGPIDLETGEIIDAPYDDEANDYADEASDVIEAEAVEPDIVIDPEQTLASKLEGLPELTLSVAHDWTNKIKKAADKKELSVVGQELALAKKTIPTIAYDALVEFYKARSESFKTAF